VWPLAKRASRTSTPGAAINVSRIEHDNLTDQIGKQARRIERLERELATMRDIVDRRRAAQGKRAGAPSRRSDD
jgi:hypothetical protein